jgi:hypothetical protein
MSPNTGSEYQGFLMRVLQSLYDWIQLLFDLSPDSPTKSGHRKQCKGISNRFSFENSALFSTQVTV